jgi:alanine dehydrogenase
MSAMSTVRDFESVRVFSSTREQRMEFAASFDETLEADVPPVADEAAGMKYFRRALDAYDVTSDR